MIRLKYAGLVFKQVIRHRTRTILTVAGVAVAMFLFVAVQTIQNAVQHATSATAADTTLIVYRENRFCPATSRLPEYYLDRILKIPGVASAVPMKIVVNNCAASLDVITFRGIPDDHLPEVSRHWQILQGSLEDWNKRSDAVMLGARLAERRGFRVGQSFDAAGITVNVAGILHSTELQDDNVGYVHLPFLQRAAAKGGLGIVTQFNVKVTDPAQLDAVARAIDADFRHEAEPTQTRTEKAFVAQAGADIVEIVRFTRFLGWGCLLAVLALVANAIILSVQDRVQQHAVLQTLGFRSGLIARLILAEGTVVGLLGGSIGTLIAALIVRWGNLTLSTEGLNITVNTQWSVCLIGLLISAFTGILAGLVPAWQASRREIAQCFRAV